MEAASEAPSREGCGANQHTSQSGSPFTEREESTVVAVVALAFVAAVGVYAACSGAAAGGGPRAFIDVYVATGALHTACISTRHFPSAVLNSLVKLSNVAAALS